MVQCFEIVTVLARHGYVVSMWPVEGLDRWYLELVF